MGIEGAWFQKIPPNRRNLGGRNKILIVSDDLETTVKSHDIPLRGIYHLMRDLQDTLLSHSLSVHLPEMSNIVVDKVGGS